MTDDKESGPGCATFIVLALVVLLTGVHVRGCDQEAKACGGRGVLTWTDRVELVCPDSLMVKRRSEP